MTRQPSIDFEWKMEAWLEMSVMRGWIMDYDESYEENVFLKTLNIEPYN